MHAAHPAVKVNSHQAQGHAVEIIISTVYADIGLRLYAQVLQNIQTWVMNTDTALKLPHIPTAVGEPDAGSCVAVFLV